MQYFKTINVLVIDDDNLTLKVTKSVLNTIGFESIKLVTTAKESIITLEDPNIRIDLIILDLKMPDMDGIELIRLLGEIEYKGHLIIFSGEDESILCSAKDLATARNISVLGFLQKPIDSQKILKLIQPSNEHRKIEKVKRSESFVSLEMIKEAISLKTFEPWFQPQVDVKTKEIVGVEALARWPIGINSYISPEDFIPVAEENKLINQITYILIEKIINVYNSWIAEGIDLDIAINISGDSLSDINFPEQFCSKFEKCPDLLKKSTIEITETKILNDLTSPLDVLLRLHLKEIKLSIDDFGTGYSDISQLKSLPFNELKIDREYVQSNEIEKKTFVILKSSINLAKNLDMRIIAEGVETYQEWERIKSLKCDVCQGFLTGKPMPGYEFIDWYKKWDQIKDRILPE